MKKNLSKLFAPKSIAIVGVSEDTRKIGTTIFSNLISSGYQGKIYPVNPKHKELFNYPSFKKVSDIPHRVELAIIAVPTAVVEAILKDCAQKKVRNAIIITAGYSERGEEGSALEAKLEKIATEANINILGPNCLGVIVPAQKMNASFAASNPKLGDVAFMSQSGAVCTALLDKAAQKGVGFSHFVSLGNKLGITENDLLEYWLLADNVKVIGAYLEEFYDGLDFIDAKERLKVEKPIVVIHPGESEQAQNAMVSHTGSLASDSDLITAALRKAGITRVRDISSASIIMEAFSKLDLPSGRNIAVLTNAGGPGILATDELVSAGMKLAELRKPTLTKLESALPRAASVLNPIDILGDAEAARYQASLEILLAADEIDAVLLVLTPQFVTQIEETAKLLVSYAGHSKPIIPVFIGGKYVEAGLQRLADNENLGFSDLHSAVTALAAMADYADHLAQKGSRAKLSDLKTQAKANKKKDLLALVSGKSSAGHEAEPALPESAVTELLASYGLKTPKSKVVNNLEQGLEAAEEIGYPLVIKATTEDVVHKTDIKAIYTGVADEKSLRSKLTKLQEGIYKSTGRDYPPVLVQEQLLGDYEELFLGFKRDGGADVYKKNGLGFGHLVVFGKGGIYTEVYRDIAKDILPLTRQNAGDLIDRTRISEVIAGARGKSALDRTGLLDSILKLQQLVIDHPEISHLDINPIMLSKKGCYIVDAKIFVKA